MSVMLLLLTLSWLLDAGGSSFFFAIAKAFSDSDHLCLTGTSDWRVAVLIALSNTGSRKGKTPQDTARCIRIQHTAPYFLFHASDLCL